MASHLRVGSEVNITYHTAGEGSAFTPGTVTNLTNSYIEVELPPNQGSAISAFSWANIISVYVTVS